MSEYTRIAERARGTTPDLLAIVEMVIALDSASRAGKLDSWSDWFDQWRQMVALAHAAIANARGPDLIAASPDLLALAERVVATFGPNTVCFASLAAEAKAAIAKARGAE